MDKEAMAKQLEHIKFVERESDKFLLQLHKLFNSKQSQIPLFTVALSAGIDKPLANEILEYLIGEGYVERGSASHPSDGPYIGITPIGSKRVKEILSKALSLNTSTIQPKNIAIAEAMPDFSKITLDEKYNKILSERWDEAIRCANIEAYMAASVMLGSILEGVLYAMANNNQTTAQLSKGAPKDRDIGKWNLNDLINVATAEGWIKRDRRAFAEVVRDYRNLIHPKEQVKKEIALNRNDFMVSLHSIKAAIEDVEFALKGNALPDRNRDKSLLAKSNEPNKSISPKCAKIIVDLKPSPNESHGCHNTYIIIYNDGDVDATNVRLLIEGKPPSDYRGEREWISPNDDAIEIPAHRDFNYIVFENDNIVAREFNVDVYWDDITARDKHIKKTFARDYKSKYFV
ncbi:hypothetical protein [Methanocella sp. MCL-LM]|uniref:hypothetical protein n=1 Tax=Methanocella sp. MCL-LM TaxID=3412035 RepID=UPI003C71D1B8